MSEAVYPFKIPVVSALPSASNYTYRLVSYNNKVFFSDGTNWIELGGWDEERIQEIEEELKKKQYWVKASRNVITRTMATQTKNYPDVNRRINGTWNFTIT